MTNFKLPVAALLLMGFVPVISACSMYSETAMTPNKIQVEEQKITEQIAVNELDNDRIAGLAHHYTRYGDGPVDLTITYDPKSHGSTAMKAGNEAARVVQQLKANGVIDVNANILPVNGQGDQSLAVISYLSYNALAPKDCTTMEGLSHNTLTVDETYRLGCTVDTVFARQIARPKDLKGQGQEDASSDGRRSSNIVDIYRTGAPNEPLEGETASD